MLALTDLAVGGVFERHPALRVGLVEFTSSWFGPFLRMVDVTYKFHSRLQRPATRPPRLAPSDYLRRQVRLATFGFEQPAVLTADGRRPVHVRQRLPARRGAGASPAGLRGVGWTCSVIAIPRALSRQRGLGARPLSINADPRDSSPQLSHPSCDQDRGSGRRLVPWCVRLRRLTHPSTWRTSSAGWRTRDAPNVHERSSLGSYHQYVSGGTDFRSTSPLTQGFPPPSLRG